MKSLRNQMILRPVPWAVRTALFALCVAPMPGFAQAVANDDLTALLYPLDYFEAGAINVSHTSPKFGEYNGLDRSGPYALGGFDLRGGNGYGNGDGTIRFEAKGSDLGTTSRSLSASAADQERWKFGVSYDQLRHYTTNGDYLTPYQGRVGANLFLLAPGFGVINTTTTTANGVITSASKGAQTLTPAQLAAFHGVNVYVERSNAGFGAGVNFNPEWGFKFDYKRVDQSGGKLIAASSDAYNLTSAGGFNYGGERVVIVINPTEYKNDTFNMSLNWVGRQAYASVGYYASFFHDDFSGVSWSNPFVSGGTGAAPKPATGTTPGAAFPISTMSTPPSNNFGQLNFTGGYIFSAQTKLTGGLSFGRNTQNSSYAGTYTTVPNTAVVLPVSSLDGHVDTTHADLKLTHQATHALNLSAGAKYNERDNKTASNSYTFLDLGGVSGTVVNIPMSYKRGQFDAAADFRFDARQRLHLGYEYDHIERWCNNDLANNARGILSTINAGYYKVASCVQIPKNTENRLVGTYKLKLGEKIDFNLGYTHGRRTAEVNPSFYNPMQANSQGFENFGYRAFFDASRKQDLLKAGLNWQPTDKLSLSLNGRHTKDNYFDSPLGVQSGESASANLDASYSLTEDNSFGGYVSWQKRTRDLLTATGRNAVAPLTTLWANTLADRDNTVGLNGKQKGLLHGKFEFSEDLTYSLAKSKYYTTLVQNIVPAVGNSGTSPNILSELTQLRLMGTYHADASSQVMLGYVYQKLKSNDYFYNAYQYGFTPTSLLPTMQGAPNYSVSAIFAAYRYSFR